MSVPSIKKSRTLGYLTMKATYKNWQHATPDQRFECCTIPEPNTGCLLWVGAVDVFGYGTIRVDGVFKKAHRFAYEREVGPVPSGTELDHKCRERSCCNPDHLEPVTHAENVRRGRAGAKNREKTVCKHGHAFDDANTYLDAKTGRRACRACKSQRIAMQRSADPEAARANGRKYDALRRARKRARVAA